MFKFSPQFFIHFVHYKVEKEELHVKPCGGKAMIKANGNRKISIAFVWEEIYEK